MNSNKFFYIKSKMNGLVLDVKGSDKSPGTEVIMWEKGADKENQIWWQDDSTRTIKSKLTGYCMDLNASGEAKLHDGVYKITCMLSWLPR